MPHDERRCTPRVDLSSLVTVEEQARRDEGVSTLGRALDVSQGGLRLELCLPLQADSTVHLRLVLQQALLVATGQVRWVRSAETGAYQHGIRFTGLTNGGAEVLQGYLHAQGSAPN